ncbi:sensor histidine kinase [Leptospira kirschneri]|uniref:sensor histidine kinase n=1 Tax=Leptospira kirschneri TaxID=29507 RepID=UPI0002D35947|nr:ATP-binding protein [Leptospira kirschneri]KON76737.1 GHKL domain protein [Leptospira kirschneri serovar Mozdok]KPZ76410.1 histidine kinase [Leptospira kirschneri serovar Mozdok]
MIECQILSHLRAPIAILNSDLRIINCNSSFVKVCFTSRAQELINQRLDQILSFQNSSLLERFRNCEFNRTIFFEEQLLNSFREKVDFQGSMTKQKFEESEFLFLEISDLKIKTKEMEIAAIVSRMYHDLQEPIRNQNTFLNLLYEKYSNSLNEKGKEFLQFSIQSSQRLWERINGLLLFLKIEKERNVFKTVSLQKILEESITVLHENLINTSLHVEVQGEFPDILGSKSLLKELFLNLISNSIRFRNKNAACKVCISCDSKSQFHLIQVIDNGIGVHYLEKNYFIDLFRTFHSSEELSGSGTGLFFCKRIAELHGGNLEIETDRTSGFGVIIRLPREFILER